MAETLYASFMDPADAERAVGALLDHGVRDEDVSLVSSETHGRRHMDSHPDRWVDEAGSWRYRHTDADADYDDEDENPVAMAKSGVSTTTGADAASGAAKGAGIGLGLGALAALGALFIPGVGLIAGPSAIAWATGAAAATAAAGAVAGGVTGYLKDQGVPEHAATHYGETIERGGAVIAVRLPSGDVSETEARGVLDKYGASNVGMYGAGRVM